MNTKPPMPDFEGNNKKGDRYESVSSKTKSVDIFGMGLESALNELCAINAKIIDINVNLSALQLYWDCLSIDIASQLNLGADYSTQDLLLDFISNGYSLPEKYKMYEKKGTEVSDMVKRNMAEFAMMTGGRYYNGDEEDEDEFGGVD